MTAELIAAFAIHLATGAVLPGPASGGARLRCVRAECRLVPAVVRPGGEARLEVTIFPLRGFRWHEARLAPSSAEIIPAPGWKVEPERLALPPATRAAGPRSFSVKLSAPEAPGAQGDAALRLKLRYAVVGPAARGEETPDASSGNVVFEEADVQVSLPLLKRARPASHETPPPSEKDAKSKVSEDAPPPESSSRASPILPALFFAIAAILVLGGLAIWTRRARERN